MGRMIVFYPKAQLEQTGALEQNAVFWASATVQNCTVADCSTGAEWTVGRAMLLLLQSNAVQYTHPPLGGVCSNWSNWSRPHRPGVGLRNAIDRVSGRTGATEARSRSMAVSCRSSKDGRARVRDDTAPLWFRDRVSVPQTCGPGGARRAPSQTPQNIGLTGLTGLTLKLTVNGGAHG